MPKKEYIDVELLKKSAKKYGITLPSIMMNALPNADVRENVRGEWIITGEVRGALGMVHKIRKCSNCEYTSFEEYNFCSNCGADMRGNNDGE